MRRVVAAACALVLTGALAGCSGEGAGEEPEAAPTSSSDGADDGAEESPPTDQPSEEPSEDALPPVRDPVSLPALMREEPDGGRLRQVRVVAETDAYTRSEVTYRSGELTVSGVLLVPRGPGPFPGIVLNHGYIEPEIYVTGQGLAREQDWLARAGYVVLHTDYRGHAASDPAGDLDRESRLGYTRDAINAVDALRRHPAVDADRLAMLGRSMGGAVTLNALVAQPGLVDAAVIYASVSSNYVDNLRQFTEPGRPDAAQALYDRYGTPEESPGFYRRLSSRTYLDRIEDPLLALHGTADSTCPVRWATDTQEAMEAVGAPARLTLFEGEEHAFVPQWQASIEQVVRFLDRRLR